MKDLMVLVTVVGVTMMLALPLKRQQREVNTDAKEISDVSTPASGDYLPKSKEKKELTKVNG